MLRRLQRSAVSDGRGAISVTLRHSCAGQRWHSAYGKQNNTGSPPTLPPRDFPFSFDSPAHTIYVVPQSWNFRLHTYFYRHAPRSRAFASRAAGLSCAPEVPRQGASGTRQSLHHSRHRLYAYLAQRVPSLFLASSFRMCLDCEVLKGMFPWRTRHP